MWNEDKKTNVKQLMNYYENKKNYPCPLTQTLIKAGYQQTSGGYIDVAFKNNIEVDYRKAEPNQWWHLIEAYCKGKEPTFIFNKRIKCGELIFWMAEVSNCVDKSDLKKLLDKIIESGKPYDRRKWNDEIQNLCFEKIKNIVEQEGWSTVFNSIVKGGNITTFFCLAYHLSEEIIDELKRQEKMDSKKAEQSQEGILAGGDF